MKPVEFDYVRAGSLREAVDALASRPGEAKVIAGGQSLVPLMNFRLVTPSLLVDINRIPGLDLIEQVDSELRIGATTRQADVQADPLVRAGWPLLSEALAHVGHPQLRNRGTVVGSLVHHDPAAELPAVAVALDALVTLTGPAGERTVAADDFFRTYFTTDVAEDEVATSVRFPAPPPGAGSAFVEIARRPGDFAMVGVAALVQVRDQSIVGARIAVSGVGERPVRCRHAEAWLTGRRPDEDTCAEAGRVAATEPGIAPRDDVHATAAYRRRVLPVLVRRALLTAAHRAAASTLSGSR